MTVAHPVAPAQTALSLSGVVKEYPGTPPVRALGGIDLRIADGELVSIVDWKLIQKHKA